MLIKKGVMIVCLFFLIFTLFDFASAEIVCTDSDGGDNIYEKGVTQRNPEQYGVINNHEDYCNSLGQVEEGVCTDINTIHRYNYDCPEGYECQDGACVTFSETPKYFCIDSEENKTDPKKYFLTQGTCTDSAGIHTDQCSDSNSVEDWYCTSPSGDCGLRGSNCENVFGQGYICKNGACVNASSIYETKEIINTTETIEVPPEITPIECSDTDGGIDIYNKGIVESEGNTFVDSCGMLNGEEVILEAVCEKTGGKVIEFFCSHGCKNGACIKVESEDQPKEPPKIIETVEKSFLSTDCWDLNKNGIMELTEDKNFNDKIDVFDCLVGEKKEEVKERFNKYINETIKIIPFLFSEANINLIIQDLNNTRLIYGVKISKGIIKSFEMIELESPNYIIEINETSAKQMLISENPKLKIINLYLNKKIIIKPQTFFAKIKYFFVNRLKIVG